MKYSMMSYTLARQGNFDIKAMFDLMKELNLDGIDMVTLYGKTASEIRKMADDYGVKVIAHTPILSAYAADPVGGFSPALDSCKQAIDDALILGAPVLMTPPFPIKDKTVDESRAAWIKLMKEVVPMAMKHGLHFSLENFPGADSPLVTADDFLKFQAEVPALKLTFDNGNAGSAEPPGESFKKTAKYTVHAHFKDWTPDPDGRLMSDGKRYSAALIGEGVIDQKATLKAMKECNYQGYINIEYEGSMYKADDAVRKALAYLRSIEA